MIRGLRSLMALATLTIVATTTAVALIVEVPRRHPLSVNKGRRWE